MLSIWESITKRISCRSYKNEPLSAEHIAKLKACIEKINNESGMNFKLVNTPDSKLKLAGAMFSGNIHTYAVLSGKDTPLDGEKVGYYGEKLVLLATQLGIGTCWVGGTYDKKSVSVEIPSDEKIWDVIPFGYATDEMPVKQKMIRSMLRKKDRKLEEIVVSDTAYSELPEWVRKGTESVLLGPSAVNQQPVNIVYNDGTVKMKIRKSGHGFEYNDMGIAKYHFEIGAAECGIHGKWNFGDDERFIAE